MEGKIQCSGINKLQQQLDDDGQMLEMLIYFSNINTNKI